MLRTLPNRARSVLILARRTSIIDQDHHTFGLRIERLANRRRHSGTVVVQAANIGDFPAGAADAVVVGDEIAGHGGRGVLARGTAETACHCLGETLAVAGDGRLHFLADVSVRGEWGLHGVACGDILHVGAGYEREEIECKPDGTDKHRHWSKRG